MEKGIALPLRRKRMTEWHLSQQCRHCLIREKSTTDQFINGRLATRASKNIYAHIYTCVGKCSSLVRQGKLKRKYIIQLRYWNEAMCSSVTQRAQKMESFFTKHNYDLAVSCSCVLLIEFAVNGGRNYRDLGHLLSHVGAIQSFPGKNAGLF